MPVDDRSREDRAWVTIDSPAGRRVRTNSYEDYEDGARFVTVLDGQVSVHHVLSEQWAGPDADAAMRAMSDLWQAASAGLAVTDADYGPEFSYLLTRGAVRCQVRGEHVRLVDAAGEEIDGQYWLADEWIEEPELVMGAILGAALALT